jgi:hypothetical protein
MRVKSIEVGATYWVGVPEGLPSRLYGSPGSRRGAELRRLCGRRFELTVIRVEISARPCPMVEGTSTVEIPLVAVGVSTGEPLSIRGRARIRVPARWLRGESRPVS